MSTFLHATHPKVKQLSIHNFFTILLCIQFPGTFLFFHDDTFTKLPISHCTPYFDLFKPTDVCGCSTVLTIFFFWISPHPNRSFICARLHTHFICPYNQPPVLNSPMQMLFRKFQSSSNLCRTQP